MTSGWFPASIKPWSCPQCCWFVCWLVLSLFSNLLFYHEMSSNFKFQLILVLSYGSLRSNLMSLKKMKSIKGMASTSKPTCRDPALTVSPPVPEEQLSLFLHTWNWGCNFHTVSIFLFCPSPGSLHHPLIPNIVHLQFSQCLSSLYTQHSRLFHPEITNQYKQKEIASCDIAITLQKFCKVVHA